MSRWTALGLLSVGARAAQPSLSVGLGPPGPAPSATVGRQPIEPIRSVGAASLSSATRDELERLLTTLQRGHTTRREEAVREIVGLGPAVLDELARARAAAAKEKDEDLASLIAMARLRIALEHPSELDSSRRELVASDPGSIELAAVALALASPAAVPTLVDRATHASPATRTAALRALALHAAAGSRDAREEAAKLVLPLFRARLTEDEDSAVRETAAWALGRLRASDPESVAALERALRDPDTSVRYWALASLDRAGAAGLPGLFAAFEVDVLHPSAGARIARRGAAARSAVLRALEELEREPAPPEEEEEPIGERPFGGRAQPTGSDAPAAPVVVADTAYGTKRRALIRLLGVVGEADEAALSALRAPLEDSAAGVRAEALLALASNFAGVDGVSLADAESELARALRSGLTDDEPWVRHAAAEGAALFPDQVRHLGTELLQALALDMAQGLDGASCAHALLVGDVRGREFAEQGLSQLELFGSEHGSPLIIVLGRMSDELLPVVRERIGETLLTRKIETYGTLLATFGEEAIPDLLALTEHEEPDVRALAFRLLGVSGERTPEIAARLEDAWREKELRPSVAMAAARPALGKSGFLRKAVRVLDDLPAPAQRELVRGLALHSEPSSRLVGQLKDLAKKSSSMTVRRTAIGGLTTIEGLAKAREEALVELYEAYEGLDVLPAQRGTQRERQLADLRGGVLLALGKMDELGDEGLDLLTAALSVRDTDHALFAVDALRAHPPTDEEHVAALGRLVGHFEPRLHFATLRACAELGGAARSILPLLANSLVGLRGERELMFDAEITEMNLRALAQLGADAEPALPMLLHLLRFEGLERVWWEREQGEQDLAPGRWRAVAGTPNWNEVRAAAAELIGRIGAEHPEAARLARPFLDEAAGDPSAVVAEAARAALAAL